MSHFWIRLDLLESFGLVFWLICARFVFFFCDSHLFSHCFSLVSLCTTVSHPSLYEEKTGRERLWNGVLNRVPGHVRFSRSWGTIWLVVTVLPIKFQRTRTERITTLLLHILYLYRKYISWKAIPDMAIDHVDVKRFCVVLSLSIKCRIRCETRLCWHVISVSFESNRRRNLEQFVFKQSWDYSVSTQQ